MATERNRTHLGTLYRLQGIEPDINELLSVFDPVVLDERNAQLDLFQLVGADAAFVQADFSLDSANWCEDAQITTGIRIHHPEERSGGLLVFALDDHVYAMGYGQGHRLLRDEFKDQRFGIQFVARCIGAQQVSDLVRRRPGSGGRMDTTHIPAGAALSVLGLDAGIELVGRLGGKAAELEFTYEGRALQLDGGIGLRTRFGLLPDDFVADVREIARVLREEDPVPGMEIIDYLAPVTDPVVLPELDLDLEQRLGDRDATGMVLVPPADRMKDWERARTFELKIGSARRPVEEVTIEDVIQRCYVQKDGERVSTLRSGRIDLYSDKYRQDLIVSLNAYKCLEIATSIHSHRYFLMEGQWYELDAAHLAAQTTKAASLFRTTPSLDLPAWDRVVHKDEKQYNIWLPTQRSGYVNLDRDTVRVGMHKYGGVEICDQLAPDDTLVLVKRAASSKELSHLCSQAIVAARTLIGTHEAREAFAEIVATAGAGIGRTIASDFIPKKMVFAILHEKGRRLIPETLFPFALVTLVQTAAYLEALGIDVEVIGISPADLSPGDTDQQDP